jgi:CRP-like cAMP-binding protein
VTLKGVQDNNPKGYLTTGVKVLKHCSTFAGLGEAQLNEIAAAARPHHFNKGNFIFHQGDPPNFFYVVQQGIVKTFKVSPFGKHIIVKIASFGDTLNASALFGEKHFVSAQAIDEVVVLSIRKKEYLSLVNKYPLIAMNIVTILGKGLDNEYERILDLVGETVEHRLCNFLFMLFIKFGTILSLTREELANLAGTTTETTIRVLSKLKAAGIISSGRGKIIISNQAKLQALAQHDDQSE